MILWFLYLLSHSLVILMSVWYLPPLTFSRSFLNSQLFSGSLSQVNPGAIFSESCDFWCHEMPWGAPSFLPPSPSPLLLLLLLHWRVPGIRAPGSPSHFSLLLQLPIPSAHGSQILLLTSTKDILRAPWLYFSGYPAFLGRVPSVVLASMSNSTCLKLNPKSSFSHQLQLPASLFPLKTVPPRLGD